MAVEEKKAAVEKAPAPEAAKPQSTSLEELNALIAQARAAQKKYAEFSQEKVDAIFQAAALAADKAAFSLAKEAVEETGMGNFEDKVIKNHYASQYIYAQYANTRTCGIISESLSAPGVKNLRIAEPLGVVAAVVPCTNPTATAIFKSLLALKTRNGMVFSPHPRAKACTAHAVKIVMDAAVKAGAPKGLIACIPSPSVETSAALMKLCDITLATGGPGMVASAYSSGKPALGVGPGNVSVLVDESADLRKAASCIIHSKGFDNGVICASEQNCVFSGSDEKYAEFKRQLESLGAYFVRPEDMDKFRNVLMRHNPKNPAIMSASPAITGRSPKAIADMAGVEVPEDTRLLVGEITDYETSEAWAHEKLSPTLSLIHAKDFESGLKVAEHLVEHGGHGHTASLHVDPAREDLIEEFGLTMETCRIVVNMPSSQGAIGGIYTDEIRPSLTLGCGSWGNNSTWENIGVNNLLNIKTVAVSEPEVINDGAFDAHYLEKVPFYSGKKALEDGLSAISKEVEAGRIVIVVNSGNAGLGKSFASKLDVKHRRKKPAVYEASACDSKNVAALCDVIRSKEAVAIVALGDSVTANLAKYALIYLADPKADLSVLSMPVLSTAKRIVDVPCADLALIMVPTDPWSYASYDCTLSFTEKNRHYEVIDSSLAPDIVIASKEFIKDRDDEDAYEHAYAAMARLVSGTCSLLSDEDVIAEAGEGIKSAYKIFEKKASLGKEIDLGAWAGTISGWAGGGLVDALSESLAETFKVDADKAYCVLLPACLAQAVNDCPYKLGTAPGYYQPEGSSRIKELGEKIGITDFLDWVSNIRVELHLPTVLADLGITPADLENNLDKAVDLAFKKQQILTAPVYSRVVKMKELLKSLL